MSRIVSPKKEFLALHMLGQNINTNYSFILLPVCDIEDFSFSGAKPGHTLMSTDGKEIKIYDICIVNICTSMFRNLCRLKYGVEPEVVTAQWKRNLISLGYPPTVVSKTHAVVVWYKKDENKGLSLGVIKGDEKERRKDLIKEFVSDVIT